MSKYSREEIDDMTGIEARRLVKKLGLSAKKANEMGVDELKDWLFENQDGGAAEEDEKSDKKEKKEKKGKGSKLKKEKSGGSRLKRGRGRKVDEEEAKDEEESKDEEEEEKGQEKRSKKSSKASSPSQQSDLVQILQKIDERLTRQEKKIDDIGEIVDGLSDAADARGKEVTKALKESADNAWAAREMIFHLGSWLENDEVLTIDNAPDDLGFSDLDKEINEKLEEEEEEGK